jgi:hypothetical protein
MSSIRQRPYGLSTPQHFRQKETWRHSALYPTYDVPQVWLQHGLKFSGLHPHPSSQIDDHRGAKGAAHAKPATRLGVLEQEREEISRSQDGTHSREQILPDSACDLVGQRRFRHVGYCQGPWSTPSGQSPQGKSHGTTIARVKWDTLKSRSGVQLHAFQRKQFGWRISYPKVTAEIVAATM